ncbi:MAG: tRNA epoxyqueuosine(34) reductase QueG [candidate division Zixibacteria bacterium]|nr:tRNA epoxyqueuosine(34) reductase QueG [candidate division Zixibacteria bacterium]
MLTADLTRRLAREVGFDLCGITGPEPIVDAVARFSGWLESGHHAEMDWLARSLNRRSDPNEVLPGVRSIIMLGLNYYQPNSEPVPLGHGRVSRYARGRDYHKVIAAMSEQLIAKLEEQAPAEEYVPSEEQVPASEDHKFSAYVDHGAVLERAYAVKAGLGYTGKNALLINRDFGSWVFLAVILTTVELEIDDPDAIDHGTCNDCTLCVDSCPTEAILPGGVIEAARCISYLTVEDPTERDDLLDRKTGRLIFGCDICQEVCPHNLKRSQPAGRAEFGAEYGVGEFLDAHKVLNIESQGEFLDLAVGTSLMRPKLDGLKKNATVVLENERRESEDQK